MKKLSVIFLFAGSICNLAAQTAAEKSVYGDWTWLDTDNRPEYRQGCILAADPDGFLYLFGGNDGARIINDFWRFEMYSWTWEEIELPEHIVVLNGSEGLFLAAKRLFICGSAPVTISSGYIVDEGPSDDFLNTVMIYTPRTGTWDVYQTEEAPSNRIGYTVNDIGGGLVLLFGGTDFEQEGYPRVNDTWIFDTSGMRWYPAASSNTPPPRSGHAVTILDPETALLFGGRGADGRYLNDLWLLHVETMEWVLLSETNPPHPRAYHAFETVDPGHAVLYGGRSENAYDDTWVYDVVSRRWTEIHTYDSPGPRSASPDILPQTGELYLFGGSDDEYLYNDLWRLDIVIE